MCGRGGVNRTRVSSVPSRVDGHCPTPRLETPAGFQPASAALQAAGSALAHEVMAAAPSLDLGTRSFKGSRSAVELRRYGGE